MQGRTFICRTRAGLSMAAIFCVVLLSPQYAGTASEAEQLIVFIQPDVSPVAKSFRQRHLPQIRSLARTLDVDLPWWMPAKGLRRRLGLRP